MYETRVGAFGRGREVPNARALSSVCRGESDGHDRPLPKEEIGMTPVFPGPRARRFAGEAPRSRCRSR